MTDEQVAAVRAYLTDSDDCDRLFARLNLGGSYDGTSALFAMAFLEAVNQRFAPTWTVSDVIRFVAHARTWWGEQADDMNPRDAEHLIRAMLGDGSPHELDETAKVLQIPLLRVLIADKDLDDAGIDDFLGRVRERAERIPVEPR